MYVRLDKNDAVIGVISDTHGLLRAEIADYFKGVDYIIHAGDVGERWVLQKLEQLSPVLAVRGNTDSRASFPDLPENVILETNSSRIYMLHDIGLLDLDPCSCGFNAVVYGHSHSPLIDWKKGVLYFNPGSAGPYRFRLPVSIGKLKIQGSRLKPGLIRLNRK